MAKLVLVRWQMMLPERITFREITGALLSENCVFLMGGAGIRLILLFKGSFYLCLGGTLSLGGCLMCITCAFD